jgi:hypothetical protein
MTELSEARLHRIVDVMRELAGDCETDAVALDSRPFTPAGVGETFGSTLAMLRAVALAVAAIGDELLVERAAIAAAGDRPALPIAPPTEEVRP